MKISRGNPLLHPLNRIPQPVPNHLSILDHNHCWNTNFECICFHQWGLAIPRSFVIPWTTFPNSSHENKLWQPPLHPLNRIPQPVPNHLAYLCHNHCWNTPLFVLVCLCVRGQWVCCGSVVEDMETRLGKTPLFTR
jgi:hypothetical protein